jgi:hypothetical protein
MIDDETRRKRAAEDRDAIRQYVETIERHADGAINGDPQSIAWVKSQLKLWVEGRSIYPPPEGLLKVACAHFCGADALLPLQRPEEFELPLELDAACIAFQAVSNNADQGDQSAPFKERVMQHVRASWPTGTFSADAIERIGRVANNDRKTGPKKRKPKD